MPQDDQLSTPRLFHEVYGDPSADSSPQGPCSHAPRRLHSAIKFCSIAVVVMLISTAAIWVFNRKPNPNASANSFLWFAGQNKTWKQYQESQKAAGRGRLDEKEYDWTQQLLNDAYSNRR